MNFNNTVALVTGANRGIGKSLVAALLQQGVKKVYACSRTINDENMFNNDARVTPLTLDVTSEESIAAAAKASQDVTMVINNAGVLDFGDVFDMSSSQLERNFSTNFFGLLSCAKQYSPIIEKNGGGAIVNMLTLLSLVSMPGLAAYNASKSAAWSLTLSLRASLADKNISVHSVFPGAVDTDMLKGVEMPKTDPDLVAHEILQGVFDQKEDIFPDPMSAGVYNNWKIDHKSVEKQFAQM